MVVERLESQQEGGRPFYLEPHRLDLSLGKLSFSLDFWLIFVESVIHYSDQAKYKKLRQEQQRWHEQQKQEQMRQEQIRQNQMRQIRQTRQEKIRKENIGQQQTRRPHEPPHWVHDLTHKEWQDISEFFYRYFVESRRYVHVTSP